MRWCTPVLEAIAREGAGGFVVTFPTYRPDLVEELAGAAGCVFVDFRKERLAPLGLQAHTLDLSAIDAHAAARSNSAGVVLHNAEALLATRPAEVRRAYLNAFVETPRERIVLLPMAIYGGEAADHPRVIRLDQAMLPEETMLRQLASMRFQ